MFSQNYAAFILLSLSDLITSRNFELNNEKKVMFWFLIIYKTTTCICVYPNYPQLLNYLSYYKDIIIP